MSTVEVLRAARDRLAQPGAWAKGSDTNEQLGDTARACAFLAISEAEGTTFDGRDDATDALLRAIGLGDTSLSDLFDWNDAPERTLDEVLAAFDAAIAEEAKVDA